MKQLRMTRVAKDVYGNWSASSLYEFNAEKKQVLEVLTMKRYSGALLTTAKVMTLMDAATWTTSFSAGQDFMINVIRKDIRCTKLAVEKQHADADLDYIFSEATKHYAAK